MSIGDNIKHLREIHDLSQAQLGEIAGVTDKAVSTWELNIKFPRMGAIQRLADYFGLSKSDIIEGTFFQKGSPANAAFISIPVVGHVIAGIPTEAVEDIVDWEDIPKSQAQRGKFSDMLRLLRKQHNITQDKLAEDMELSKSTISMYETGKRLPSFEVLEAFADYFNVSLSVLNGEPENSAVRIPVVGNVIAGIPTEAVEDVVNWEEIPRTTAMRGDYIGLKVKGDSMNPRFIEGDTVIVRRQPDVESGEIAIVFVNGDEATMKKVVKKEDGITLIALNPSVYEPHFYSKKEIATLPVTIYGKVVELRGKF